MKRPRKSNSKPLIIGLSVVILIGLVGVLAFFFFTDMSSSEDSSIGGYAELPLGDTNNVLVPEESDPFNEETNYATNNGSSGVSSGTTGSGEIYESEDLYTETDLYYNSYYDDSSPSDWQDSVVSFSANANTDTNTNISGSNYFPTNSPESDTFAQQDLSIVDGVDQSVAGFGWITPEEIDQYNSVKSQIQERIQQDQQNGAVGAIDEEVGIEILDLPFSLSNHEDCGDLSGVGITSSPAQSDSLACLGQAFVDECSKIVVEHGDSHIYLNPISGVGCFYGTPTKSESNPGSEYDQISFCPVFLSENLLSDLDDSNVSANSDVRNLVLQFEEDLNLLLEAAAKAIDYGVETSYVQTEIDSTYDQIDNYDDINDDVYAVIGGTLEVSEENCQVYNL